MLGVAGAAIRLSDDSVSAKDDPGPLARRVELALRGRSGGWLEREAGLPKGYGSYILRGERRKLGPKFMTAIAKALSVNHQWLASGEGSMETLAQPPIEMPAGKLLIKLGDLPGLREWIVDHPEAITVAELVRGIAVYEETKPSSRSDGQPFGGWEAFFADKDRLSGPKKLGDQSAAEALERGQMSKATRRRLKKP